MTAALASALLAVALLMLPRAVGSRLVTAGLAVSGPRTVARVQVSLIPVVAAGAVLAAVVLPLGVVLAATVVAVTAVLRARRRTRRRRMEHESRALETALDVLVGELRAGAHPVAAVEAAASDTDGPVSASLRGVVARALLGADVPAGLRSVCASSALPAHWERLAVCWEFAQVHGLTMATLLRAAQRDIVERSRFAARAHAGMAGARATAAVLAGLPIVGAALGHAIGADPIGFLFSRGPGGWLLFVGVTLACCGLLWSDRITGKVLP